MLSSLSGAIGSQCWEHVGDPDRAKPGRKGEILIELVIAACLMTGECQETRLTFDAHDVSLMTCVIAGQAEIAQRQSQHPAWKVKRWHCDSVRQTAQDI